jgi:hypothetical protein
MVESTWGKENDAAARQQLGVQDESYVITMMSISVSHIDTGDVEEYMEEDGDDPYYSSDEVIKLIDDLTKEIPLGKGVVLVCLSPSDDDPSKPPVFGIVTLPQSSE